MTSLITRGILIASLTLAGNAAMAATTQVHQSVAPHAVHARAVGHVAARRPVAPQRVGVAQFIQGLFGGGWPVQVSRGSAAGSDSSDWMSSSTYDTSPPVDNGAQAAQAAADAESEAIQEMNDTNALTASMAAAEEQNDAANAATLQTEINAGM